MVETMVPKGIFLKILRAVHMTCDAIVTARLFTQIKCLHVDRQMVH